MRVLTTILLSLLTAFFVTAAVFLAVDGNLARLTGWYHYRPGLPLFSQENMAQLDDVCWMRIEDLHDKIECERDEHGTWWIISPFRDRLSQDVVRDILLFTSHSKVVDTLPLNNTTRGSMREFGVETNPHTITLKVKDGKDSYGTIARYTLGSASPWLADAEDGKSVLPTTYLRTDFYGRDKRVHVVTGNILSLFRNGLAALRDSHPLLLDAEALRQITITPTTAEPVILRRISSETDWVIASPCVAATDRNKVAELISALSRMTALRVDDAENITLPEQADYTISITAEGNDAPAEMTVYPAFYSERDGQEVRYATVKGRPVVFTLRGTPKVERKGSYANIVKAVCKLPVLTDKAMAQVKMSLSGDAVYTEDLPITVAALRSTQFADVDYKDVESFYLRSRYAHHPLRVQLVPGDSDSGVEDAWIFTAEGMPLQEAEPEMVKQFINGLRDIPVTGFLADIRPGEDSAALRRRFGLDKPTYILAIAPRSCAYRASLFGYDLPLVRDHAPRAFYLTRYTNPETGQGTWVGMEEGGTSVYSLSTKLTRNFSLQTNRWRLRNLISFPLSALRKLTLGFQQAPLELEYDYIGESWAGTLNGKDVTPLINPHRAEHYVRQLQRMRVDRWISNDDEDALRMLSNPAFTVKLELELTDYSDAETIIIDSDDIPMDGLEDGGRANVEKLLQEDENDATAKAMRDLAMAERKVIQRTVTIEIAPMNNISDNPPFYGRIKETGDIFVISFTDAQSLAGSLLDM